MSRKSISKSSVSQDGSKGEVDSERAERTVAFGESKSSGCAELESS